MTKQVLLILAAGILTGCGTMKPNARTDYVPPSTAKLGQHITRAEDHAARTADAVKKASVQAKTAKDRIKLIQQAVKEQPPVLALAVQVEGDIDLLTDILLSAGNEVTSLQGQLQQAQTEKALVQKDADEQTRLLNTANRERNAAITQSKIDRDNAHKFKAIIMIIVTLAAVVVMFGIFGMKAFIPPLLWVTIGAPVAIGAFLFFWLGSG